MSDEQLSELLHERTAAERVGPPPIAEIRRVVVRRRRGRAAVAAVAAAVVLAAGTIAAVQDGSPDRDRRPAPVERPEAPPAGMRWVGVGPAVVAVPAEWRTNAVECNRTPRRDTVIVDYGRACLMGTDRPVDVESVEIGKAYDGIVDFIDWHEADLDGGRALRSDVRELEQDSGPRTLRGYLYLPALDVLVTAESSSSDGEAIVAGLLDGVQILRDHVAVPGFSGYDWLNHPRRANSRYLDHLRATGFVVDEQGESNPGIPVVEVLPAPGTVLTPGATVVVRREDVFS